MAATLGTADATPTPAIPTDKHSRLEASIDNLVGQRTRIGLLTDQLSAIAAHLVGDIPAEDAKAELCAVPSGGCAGALDREMAALADDITRLQEQVDRIAGL